MRRVTLLPVLLATAASLGAGYVATVLLPAADRATTRRTSGTPAYTVGEAHGRRIYAAEGCVVCHTRQVRDTFSDAGLAERPTRPGDTLGDRPALLGEVRYGPDLSCVGDRVPGIRKGDGYDARVAAMMAYLEAPAEHHDGSTMPAYGYLSDPELRRLASYLVAQTCAERDATTTEAAG